MNKFRYKITNWKKYNQALINCDSLAFWIDEKAIQLWNRTKQNNHVKSRSFSDSIMTAALMVRCVFLIPLIGLQEFINSAF
ncbi:Mobile element protein [Candidatus Enterovibrio altilux]|uniref:Mobile element protein n=1 Tax=Candidatus Enterovibrio altilux TaxID=1927128 RepID=A0A291B6R4_9GAMM|nr:Mobile element protein [Candidatus Enterovibrio luxaltus]